MLKRFLNYSMIVLLAITVWLTYSIKDISFDYNFEHFFPVESDDASFYYDFRNRFGSDNEFILIGIQREKSIYDASFLNKVDSLCKTIQSFENVRSVTSITSLKLPIVNTFGIIEIPVINLQNPENLVQDSIKIAEVGNLSGSLISSDYKSLAIYIRHRDQISKSASDSLLENIEASTARLISEKTYITGKLKSERAYLNKTKFELLLFMSVSFVLVTFFLWLTFRNFWGVVVPLTVVLLAILWTVGIMAVTGKEIDIMIILMPCILFVVGMSDVIHITSQFYEKIEEGYEKVVAIRLSLEEVGFATFLTCISTSVAFLTLNTTSIQPIRDFGTYTAIGVVVAYILSITLLPFILMHVKNPDQFKVHVRQVRWDSFLRKLIKTVFRNPGKIIIASIAMVAFAVVGINTIEVNNSVLDDLDENDPIKQEFRFFDAHFSGVRGFELSVTAQKPGTILSWESLQEMIKLEDYLQKDYHVGAIVSPLGLLRGFNQATHDGDSEWYKLPENAQENAILLSQLQPWLKRKEVRQLLSEDLSEARMSGRIRDKGSKAVGIRNAGLEKFLQEQSFKHIKTRITGSSDLIDKSNEYLTDNMLQGLSLDIFALMLIIAIIFRSWRMMLISVLPNIIPLAMIAGLMGWAGIEMKVTISIIFSIAFGIAVDDTLHLLSRLKVELNKGYKFQKALMITYLSTGKAMILTAVVIAAGFSTLMLSNFKSTFYVGLLISLTLLFALLAELILMPVLLMWIYGRKNKNSASISKNQKELSA